MGQSLQNYSFAHFEETAVHKPVAHSNNQGGKHNYRKTPWLAEEGHPQEIHAITALKNTSQDGQDNEIIVNTA